MQSSRPYVAALCSMLLLPSPAGGSSQDNPVPQPSWSSPRIARRLSEPYRPKSVAPPSIENSGRLDSLLRAGNLYLSLQDTIALALENNLDIAIQRYGPQLADVGVLQAEAGGFARGVSTSVTAGPASASVSSSGTTPGSNQNAASQASSATASAVGSTVLQSSGPSIPSLDPAVVSALSWAHLTTPQTSAFVTGSSSLIQRQDISNFGVQQSFLTGTTVNLGLNNTSLTANNPRADFNPATSASLGIGITQHLFQGFGPAVNARQIRIARNNREVSDLTFKLQVETTVAAVMSLYWDLVAFNENVQVAREAITSATRLWEDNKRQVEAGTLAPIEVTRAEAQIATAEQQLTISQTQVLQQETILKTALSRTGVASPAIADAHIIPTDQINVPDTQPVAPIQDMMAMALSSRPELAQSRIQLQNQELTIRGSKNSLLPTLDAVVNFTNSALAGQPNSLPAPSGTIHSNNSFFIGGYGQVLSQLFQRNFPNYSLGFNLNIPIRNRAAQAQLMNDELTLRQQQLGLQRLENQVRTDVVNALIALTQARAQFQAASKSRALQAETLDAEQKKLALGVSNIYNVIQDQQALTAAESSEVTAKAAYAKAKVELDRATGQILTNNNVSLEEAYRGVVSRPASPLPPAPAPAPQTPQQ
ncbi:MAG TPA: TolC family protein [Bryobacteraceae bacterium]|nr:TolC family protein [Bryobacteraceae bacterium]